jgi:hypothetical protein
VREKNRRFAALRGRYLAVEVDLERILGHLHFNDDDVIIP